jgi:PIN domain nuclease of toxin-antitoxin system
LIYLDTHIAVWLYASLLTKFSSPILTMMNENELYLSPIVALELQFLFEIQRVKDPADAVIEDLSDRIGLQVCTKDFDAVIRKATTFS